MIARRHSGSDVAASRVPAVITTARPPASRALFTTERSIFERASDMRVFPDSAALEPSISAAAPHSARESPLLAELSSPSIAIRLNSDESSAASPTTWSIGGAPLPNSSHSRAG
ncbi:unannotated protein [freshwater metagenome]|uniref:Unannotated protein n=1 Tax=freshwater metagenome TaxID=449393 RepID=A0A6J7EEU0_9ZZZZ